jgi:Tol biopolymer transport system component
VQESSATALGRLPTAAGTAPLTVEGTLLGTYQYMAPEQLEGREADAASDIFALGAVLYEMATGHKAFAGKSQASLIGAIMHSSPPPVSTAAPLSTPAFDRVVATCLAKDPRDRWQTAHDVRLQLSWLAEGGSQVGLPAPVAQHRRNRERLAWGVAAALALAAAALAVGFVRRAPEPPRVVRFDVAQPAALTLAGAPKVSPDGRTIAFVGTDPKGTTQIWLRALDDLQARPLAGTEGVTPVVRPTWSPDSRHLAFFVGSKILRIPAAGGPPQPIGDGGVAGGDGTWSEQGVLLYDGSPGDPIRRIDAAGGQARVEREGGKGENAYQVAWPQFLPGGERYLYVVDSGTDAMNGVWLARLDGAEPKKVVDGLSRVEFAPPDFLLFVREATLVAQRFDTESGELVGEPVPVAEGIGVDSVGQADFSASRTGVLVYRSGQGLSDRLAWLDLAGKQLSADDELGEGHNPALSPDGRWLAVDREEGQGVDIWLRDLRRGVSSRVTTDAKDEYAPIFTLDGRSLIFSRDEGGGGFAILERSLETGAERVLLPPANRQLAFAIAPGGHLLVASRAQGEGGLQFDLHTLDLKAGGAGKPYVTSPFSEFNPTFSPDGRWVAYQSNESGRAEIYVQAFPEPGRKWQISTEGGIHPAWRAAGLFYVSGGRQLMRVDVTTEPSFDAGIPEPLADLPLASLLSRNRFLFAPDDARILAVTATGAEAALPTTVVLDWDAALRK